MRYLLSDDKNKLAAWHKPLFHWLPLQFVRVTCQDLSAVIIKIAY